MHSFLPMLPILSDRGSLKTLLKKLFTEIDPMFRIHMPAFKRPQLFYVSGVQPSYNSGTDPIRIKP